MKLCSPITHLISRTTYNYWFSSPKNLYFLHVFLVLLYIITNFLPISFPSTRPSSFTTLTSSPQNFKTNSILLCSEIMHTSPSLTPFTQVLIYFPDFNYSSWHEIDEKKCNFLSISFIQNARFSAEECRQFCFNLHALITLPITLIFLSLQSHFSYSQFNPSHLTLTLHPNTLYDPNTRVSACLIPLRFYLVESRRNGSQRRLHSSRSFVLASFHDTRGTRRQYSFSEITLKRFMHHFLHSSQDKINRVLYLQCPLLLQLRILL